jgi:hypothetical protein
MILPQVPAQERVNGFGQKMEIKRLAQLREKK